MRDILVLGIVGACTFLALSHPWLGVIGWTALSIMNFHRYAWHAAQLPLAAAIAVATMIGLLITRDRRNWSFQAPTLALLAFMVWICVTLPFSVSVSGSLAMWDRVMKIDFMIVIATLALTARRHVMVLIWTLVVSLGVYGVKGGLFTLATGGAYRVWGPPESFIEGNNELALALIMVIPLMRFLQLHVPQRWLKNALTISMLLCATAALGTQSRGALVALAAMAGTLIVLEGRRKPILIAMILLAAVALIAFFPDTWSARMATILTYNQDSSAMGRINAWWMAWRLASDKLLGGGFDIYTPEMFARYAPNPKDIHAAHSIYFQVLGEQGFIGLALFLLIWILSWRSAGWLRNRARDLPNAAWAADLGTMCKVSLVGYATGGAFLSLAYFDLPYNILVLIVVARRLVQRETRANEAGEAEQGRFASVVLQKQKVMHATGTTSGDT